MEISFTDSEADIMGVLWRRGPSTVAEVREELHAPIRRFCPWAGVARHNAISVATLALPKPLRVMSPHT